MTEPDPAAAVGAALGDQVIAMDHVGIATDDLDAALALWTGALGLRLVHREHNADQQVDEAMLAGPEGAVGSAGLVQLVAPSSPEAALARSLERRGSGLHHVALRVRDVERATAVLRAQGLRILYDHARPGTNGSSINFVHPADGAGVLVELVEHPAPDPRGLAGSSPPER